MRGSFGDLVHLYLCLDLEGTKISHCSVQVGRSCTVLETGGIEAQSDLLGGVLKEMEKLVGGSRGKNG